MLDVEAKNVGELVDEEFPLLLGEDDDEPPLDDGDGDHIPPKDDADALSASFGKKPARAVVVLFCHLMASEGDELVLLLQLLEKKLGSLAPCNPPPWWP